ncbi:hypothetical protein AB1L88_05255 [Tautonia sp. JC769]|uniref:hypothetical protein n=1 Tax=Tautonia sp. JC769 TaxID=3232135 RepID=UPI00345925A6
MSKRSKPPGRRQVPGTFRTHERKGPDPTAEPQRIVLYLPVAALDLAEQQASRARVETIQLYCESLLTQAIAAAEERTVDSHRVIGRDGRTEGSRTVADDPDYLAEWTATVLDQIDVAASPGLPGPDRPAFNDPPVDSNESENVAGRTAADVILRHAGLRGSDPGAFLTSIRREGRLDPSVGPELLRALGELEAEQGNASVLDRSLCFALHKLAFEGEILVTEGARNASMEESVVDLLRLIQERVDRVLSGQDIRYFTSHDRNTSIEG